MKYFEIEIVCHKCSILNKVEIEDTPKFYSKCQNCSSHLFVATPVNGFIYILSNPSMPGLLKIGFTSRTIKERVSELSSSTGIPTPFVCEAVFVTSLPEMDEKDIHQLFEKYRVSNKEFFKVELDKALMEISDQLGIEPSEGKESVLSMFHLQRKETIKLEEERKREARKKAKAVIEPEERDKRVRRFLKEKDLEKYEDLYGKYEDRFLKEKELKRI